MKILCVTSSFHRFGSEIVLANLLKNTAESGINFTVICRQNGELGRELPPEIPVFYPKKSLLYNIDRNLRSNAFEQYLRKIHKNIQPDYWYINTIVQPEVLRVAKNLGVPCIVHSHELEPMYARLSREEVRELAEYPALVIACSEAVAESLRTIGRSKPIEICYPPIDTGRILSDKNMRSHFGIADDAFVWAMSGTLDTNKNPEIFVDAAHHILKKGLNAHFMWIGKTTFEGFAEFAVQKARFLGISEKITWTGERTHDYYDCLQTANGFVLTSRRDSFPLVMIEAAMLGKPIVAFRSGGVAEFLQPEMGALCEYYDAQMLADTMIGIMNGNILFHATIAQKRAQEFSTSVQTPYWLGVLRKLNVK